MGLIYEMYKLVDWVDNHTKGYDTSNPEVSKKGDKWIFTASGVRENYVKFSKRTDAEIRNLIESCIEEEYLKTENKEEKIWVYVSPGKGRKLLRKSFGNIPSGFLKEVFNDNYFVLSFFAGLIGGFIPLLIYLLSKEK